MTGGENARELARMLGYHGGIEHVCRWNGFDVFSGRWTEQDDDDSAPDVGLPEFIIVRQGEVRVTRPDEAFEIIDLLDEGDDRNEWGSATVGTATDSAGVGGASKGIVIDDTASETVDRGSPEYVRLRADVMRQVARKLKRRERKRKDRPF